MDGLFIHWLIHSPIPSSKLLNKTRSLSQRIQNCTGNHIPNYHKQGLVGIKRTNGRKLMLSEKVGRESKGQVKWEGSHEAYTHSFPSRYYGGGFPGREWGERAGRKGVVPGKENTQRKGIWRIWSIPPWYGGKQELGEEECKKRYIVWTYFLVMYSWDS